MASNSTEATSQKMNAKKLNKRSSSFNLKTSGSQVKSIPATTKKKAAGKTKTGYNVVKKEATSSKAKEKPQYDQEATKNFNRMIHGELCNIPELPKTTVSIFLSSTFSDMRAERNSLVRDVYPRLRDYCAKLDMDFQVIDMRWGVTEDSQNDHSVERLCLLEVENCKRQSQGPNFIVLSGDRYGFRPIPIELDVNKFELLHSMAEKLNLPDRGLLDDWYKLDKNALPNKYILQNIRSKFTFFADYSPGCDEVRERDTNAWWNTFTSLQNVLRKSATAAHKEGKLSEYEKHQFFLSVTELEIQEGILNAKNVDNHCLVYRRKFRDLKSSALVREIAQKYIDSVRTEEGTVIDEEVAELRKSLENKISEKLSSTNIRRYNLSWGYAGLDPEQHQEDRQYVDAFCSDFIDDCTRLIDKADLANVCPVNLSNYYSDYNETIHHLRFYLSKCESFCGQEKILKKVKAYILNEKTNMPLVVHAESGIGKTSIMAMIMKSIPSWLDGKEHLKLIRFLGTSPNTNDIYDVLFSTIGQIADAFDVIIPPINYANMKALQEYVPRFLRQVASSARRPIIILLDSIDQLGAVSNAYAMKWLPLVLPTCVKFIISTLPQEHGILNNLKKLLPNSECYVKVEPLPESTGKQIMQMLLKKGKRQITEEQMELALTAFRKTPSPLFLKLLLDQARKWNWYTPIDSIHLTDTVPKAINTLFENLEKKFGCSLVSHALGYVTIGLGGLTEFEIEDVLSCDDLVLSDVYKFHDPPVPGIVRIPPVLWARIHYDIQEYLTERLSFGKTTLNWYHRQFLETAASRYAVDGKSEELHKNLTEIFLQDYGVKRTITLKQRKGLVIEDADRQVKPQPFTLANHRKLACLPYHANRACNLLGKDFVKSKILCNFNFICTRIAAFSVSRMLQDFSDFLEITSDDEVEILQSFISLSKESLAQPSRLAFSLLGHLNPDSRQTNLKSLMADAKLFLMSQAKPALIPSFPCLAPLYGVEAMLTSTQGFTEILAQSANSLLLRGQSIADEQEEEKDIPSYAIFSTDTEEMTSPVLPTKPNQVGQFCLSDTKVFLATETALIDFNLKSQTSEEHVFKNLVPRWNEAEKVKLMDFVTNIEVSQGALVFDAFIVAVNMQKVVLIQKFLPENPKDMFDTCLVTNEDTIIGFGKRKNSSGDSASSQQFICKLSSTSNSRAEYFETDKSLQYGTQTLAGGENHLFIAARVCQNAEPESKVDLKDGITAGQTVLKFDLKTLALNTTFSVSSDVVKILGHPEDPEAFVLTKGGTAVWLGSKVELEVQLDFSVVEIAVLWDEKLVFLGSESGNITIYNYKTSKSLGVLTAYPVRVKDIRILQQTCVTLGCNSELKSWSVKSMLNNSNRGNADNEKASTELHEQLHITGIAVSDTEEELFTCSRDGCLSIWDNSTLQLIKKVNIGIAGNVLHALNAALVVHDTVTGKLGIFNPFTGDTRFKLPSSVQNVLASVMNARKSMLYLVSAPKKGKEQIDIVNIEKFVFVKSVVLQPNITYKSLEILLSQKENYLIFKCEIYEQEFQQIKARWKTGGFSTQNHRHKFFALDITQSSGTLIRCNRLMSTIPLLGNNIQPGELNTMLITVRRYVMFWDIPTGKADQKLSRDVKEPFMYRPTWLGQSCVGTSKALQVDPAVKFAAVGSEDGYVFVYDMTTGTPPGRKKAATKHSGNVHTLAISPDSKWVVSVCTTNTLKLWDSKTMVEHVSIKLDAKVQQIFFSSSSSRLVLFTGTHTTRMMVFDVKK